jgi:hypothetical protein
LSALKKQRNNTSGLIDFFRNNHELLKSVGEEIFDLSPTDKQRLIEAMLSDKIADMSGVAGEAEFWGVYPSFTFNINILQTLSEEGKLDSINPR